MRNVVLMAMISVGTTVMLSGCGGDIATVKDGYLNSYKSTTIGNAFNNYKVYDKTQWSDFKTDNGEKVVEFIGKMKPEALTGICTLLDGIEQDDIKESKKQCISIFSDIKSAEHIVQFTINHDNTFEINSIEFKYVWSNGKISKNSLELKDFLADLYNNKYVFEDFSNSPSDQRWQIVTILTKSFSMLKQQAK